jgi:hypothetical protein
MKKLLVTTMLVMLCAVGLGDLSPPLPLVSTAHAQPASPGAPGRGAVCQAHTQLAARVIPAIIGDGGALCILKIQCDRGCVAMAKQICEAHCGKREGTCYNVCYMDYRGDCCEEVCEYR